MIVPLDIRLPIGGRESRLDCFTPSTLCIDDEEEEGGLDSSSSAPSLGVGGMTAGSATMGSVDTAVDSRNVAVIA